MGHSSAREDRAGGLSSRSTPFESFGEPPRVPTPENAVQDMFEDDDPEFRAAIEASLSDYQNSESFSFYETPDYPKDEQGVLDQLDDANSNLSVTSVHNSQSPFEETELIDMEDHTDTDTWSETWTVTDGSERAHSDTDSPDEQVQSDHEWTDNAMLDIDGNAVVLT